MNVIYRLIYTLLAVGTFFQLPAQNAYRIEFELEELRDTVVNLTYFHGANNYYQDTAFVDSKGKFVFEGEVALKEGLYSVIKGNAKLLDLFIVGEQKFSMKSELRDLVGEMEVDGNKENEIFYEYLSFLKEKQSLANKLSQSKESLTEGSPEYEKVQKEMDELNEEVSEYIEEFKKKNSKSFTAKFLRSMEYPSLSEKAKKDSVYQLGYIREHLFDNIDFEDERMLRIPSYHEKMMYLMEKLTYPEPDSIIESVEFLLAKAEKNPEIFKYTLAYLTNHYEASKKMGMDAVFVHLAKNYYLKGKAPWVDQKQINKLDERVKALEPLLIGKKAPNIIAKDTAQQEIVSLYDVDAKYTVVYIWSPECGHCKVATPELLEIYHKFKDKGVEVFAVGNEFENKEWLEFIRKHQLDWINVSDGGTFRSNFRSLYDVYSTPQTYLLDENKIILSKKMDMPSLERILEHQIEKDEKKQMENEQ